VTIRSGLNFIEDIDIDTDNQAPVTLNKVVEQPRRELNRVQG